jgi:hypothetical protein
LPAVITTSSASAGIYAPPAFAEHRRDLRDARRRHTALAIERAAEVILIGKNLVALLQVGAAAVHEINNRQFVLERDVLGAYVLSNRLLEERAALHGRVVGDDHADHAADRADASYNPGRGHGIAVKPPGRQRRKLEERTERIEQVVDAFANGDLAAFAMALDHAFAAAGDRPALPFAQRP